METLVDISIDSGLAYITDSLTSIKTKEISDEIVSGLRGTIGLLKHILDKNSSLHDDDLVPNFIEKGIVYTVKVSDLALLKYYTNMQNETDNEYSTRINSVMENIDKMHELSEEKSSVLRENIRKLIGSYANAKSKRYSEVYL